MWNPPYLCSVSLGRDIYCFLLVLKLKRPIFGASRYSGPPAIHSPVPPWFSPLRWNPVVWLVIQELEEANNAFLSICTGSMAYNAKRKAENIAVSSPFSAPIDRFCLQLCWAELQGLDSIFKSSSKEFERVTVIIQVLSDFTSIEDSFQASTVMKC